MTVGKTSWSSLNTGGDWNKLCDLHSQLCSWKSNQGVWWLWAGKASCTPPWHRPTRQRCWTPSVVSVGTVEQTPTAPGKASSSEKPVGVTIPTFHCYARNFLPYLFYHLCGYNYWKYLVLITDAEYSRWEQWEQKYTTTSVNQSCWLNYWNLTWQSWSAGILIKVEKHRWMELKVKLKC